MWMETYLVKSFCHCPLTKRPFNSFTLDLVWTTPRNNACTNGFCLKVLGPNANSYLFHFGPHNQHLLTHKPLRFYFILSILAIEPSQWWSKWSHYHKFLVLLISSVRIGYSNLLPPYLRLESFPPPPYMSHQFFWCLVIVFNEWDFSRIYPIFELTKEVRYMSL